jgi:rod shape determining protein RodA
MFDIPSLFIVVALGILGVVFVHSSTQGAGSSPQLWLKQASFLVSGLLIYGIFAFSDYKRWVDRADFLGLLGLAFLAAVLIWGHKVNGARSWFRLPFLSIQPAEFVKICAVLWVARHFSRIKERPSSLLEFATSWFVLSLPVALILLQPDLGTAFLYGPFFLVPNFMTGHRESIWVTLSGLFLAALVLGGVLMRPHWVFFLKDYQKERILSFVYPERDRADSGYQVHQSKISIGQGGLLGMGIGKGKQTRLGFLPAQHNDFILAVVAEETGFLGISTVLLLFAVLFGRGLATAYEARDSMGSLLAASATSTLALQTLYNAAMLTGLAPTTGIPCPLISAGGSSIWTTCALLGLVQSVRRRRFVNT